MDESTLQTLLTTTRTRTVVSTALTSILLDVELTSHLNEKNEANTEINNLRKQNQTLQNACDAYTRLERERRKERVDTGSNFLTSLVKLSLKYSRMCSELEAREDMGSKVLTLSRQLRDSEKRCRDWERRGSLTKYGDSDRVSPMYDMLL